MNQPEITRLLQESREGDREAMNALLSMVYPELHKIARAYLLKQSPGHTLQPTALLNEAYLKLAGAEVDFRNRGHFFAVCAAAMRQVLVDHARAKHADKRGGHAQPVTLNEAFARESDEPEILIAIDQALDRLAEADSRKAKVFELRHFGGLTVEETAEVMELSVATIGRELRFAEAWLRRQLLPAVS